MTTQNVIDEAKAYYDNDYTYVIEYRRDKSVFLEQMEKVINVRNKITQKIIDISQGRNDNIM